MWIVKPPGKNNGSGIFVINDPDDIPMTPSDETVLVQRYITNPLLVRGLKFDLRLYLLITSIDPIKLYMYEDGLVRFATREFSLDQEHLGDKFRHLTNYR